jgi:hypothetical protein
MNDPIGEFAHDLRALRRRAGNPSYRKLARMALFAPSVLSSAASGHRLPTLPVTLAFVAACGGDHAAWERRWHKLAARTESTAAQSAGPSLISVARPRAVSTLERTVPAPPDAGFARPAQLPMGSGTFVGREEVLAGAAQVIARTSPVTTPLMVSGPIGVGKTAFALRLADDLSAAFPDGQLYADLSVTGPAGFAVQGFLHALGVSPLLVPDDATQQIGLFRSLLTQRRLFVLLENAHDERQVRPLLGRATRSQIVVTSRARLLGLDGVHRIELDTFTRHESMALIGRLAGAERVQAEHEATDALAELCGDLPLAINIIGRKIAARPEWAVAYIAGLLADGERLMDSLSVGDVNVRDRFASAYHLLTPIARNAVHQLARGGTGPATASGLAAAMSIGVGTADELLESLVDTGLLTRADGAGRYRVSTLLGAFAADARADAPHATLVPAPVGVRINLGHSDRLPLVRANAAKVHPARSDLIA